MMSRFKLIFACLLFITVLINGVNATNYPYDGSVSENVTRDRSVAIGEDYVTLRYYVRSTNTTGCSGGTCPDPTLGWQTGMQYCWGGEDTTKQYLIRLEEGDLAGNKNTGGSSSYDSCSAGADCSGFVSNAWTSPRRYTSNFYTISDNIDWDDLRMGDATNDAGSHIRMFDYFTDDIHTTMLYESTSGGGLLWRSVHRSLAQSSYQPIRYNNTSGYHVLDYAEPVITAIVKTGIERARVRWDGQADQGFRLYQSTDGSTWSMIRDETELLPNMRYCTVSGLIPDKVYFYKMTSYNTGDSETVDSDVVAYRLDGFTPRVLLVDGADRYRNASSSPSFGENATHTFLTRVGFALASRGIGFDFCSNESVVDELVDLADYEAAVWILAEESTYDETFSWAEQMHVMNFLKGGGHLFISGGEIGWDLDYKANSSTYKNGSENDAFFYNAYLRADYDDDDADTYDAQGVTGTIFEGISLTFDNGTHGTYDVDYPDMLNTIYGSTAGMTYQGGNGGNACVYHSSPSSGTVVNMGFPFETINDESDRNAVMKATLNYFDLPVEAPTIKTLKRTASDQVTITWSGHASEGFRLFQKTADGSWSQIQNESTLGSDAQSATVSGLSCCTKYKYAFKLQAVNSGGASADSDVLTCILPQDNLGTTILLVDGFDRWYNMGGGSNHTFLENFADALENYRFDSCTNEAVADGDISLGSYEIVMWMCGGESTESETFSYTEQTLVQDFLKAGGMLFVSGAEIGWDLVEKGDTGNTYENGHSNDTPFYQDYLKADFISDDANTYQVRGVSSTDFAGLNFYFDDGTHGTYDVEWPDVISTTGGSAEALYYGASGTDVAGITFTGTVSGGAETCKIVHFGFPFETIYDATDRRDVMMSILDYFEAKACPVEMSVFSVD